MLVLVLVAAILSILASAASASFINRTFTPDGGTVTYVGSFKDKPKNEPATSILTVYAGEKITVQSSTNGSIPVVVTGPYTKEGEKYSGRPFKKESLVPDEAWDSEGKSTEGYFEVSDQYGAGGWLEMMKHSFTLEVVGKRQKVQEGKGVHIRIRENEKDGGMMKLSIEDDDGYSIVNRAGEDIYELAIGYDNQGFTEFPAETARGIAVAADRTLSVDTAELDMAKGKYTIILEDSATGARATAGITVEARFLDVSSEKEVVQGNEIVVLIASSFYGEAARLTVSGLPAGKDTITVMLDDEGKKKVRIGTERLPLGLQRITVTAGELEETIYLTITRSAVSLVVPETATVGELVPLQGRADAGNTAVILIDDIAEAVLPLTAGRFTWDWDTAAERDGYRIIELFILAEGAPPSLNIGEQVSEHWQKEQGVDASSSICLLTPSFSLTAPSSIVEGDDVVLTGAATGTGQVYLIVIDDRGDTVFPPGSIAQATPVHAGTWEERIQELEPGSYLLIALHKGRDGSTYAIVNGAWAAGGTGKMQIQRRDILVHALGAPGSDDLFELASLRVVSPYARLNLPEWAALDNELIVTAATNLKTGEMATVSLVSAPGTIITAVMTRVENGSVQASLNTSGLQPRNYTVRVEIGGRASDEGELRLVVPEERGGEEEAVPQLGSVPELEAGLESAEKRGEELVTVAPDGSPNATEAGQERTLKMPRSRYDLLAALVLGAGVRHMKRSSR